MKSVWEINISAFLIALLFSLTSNSYAGNVEVKVPTNSAFQVISGVQPLMHVGSNGKVGIGTTSPSEKLQIKSISPRLRVDSGTTGVGGDSADDARIVLKGNAPGYEGRFDLIATTAGDFRIAGFNGTETHIGDFITVNQSGNVGIGTTSPGYKLHVDGLFAAKGLARILNPGGVPLKVASYSWLILITRLLPERLLLITMDGQILRDG